ncbi:hypothetical protein [Pseudarthrobacter sp. LMD1-1-1.1]|uniref:hypothetical protein n=1 Tax=Pseudarthrobacter sp. LMD1-1-1.1 TaxID=3135242 RepID=UPI003417E6B3
MNRCQHCAADFADECGEWCVYYRYSPSCDQGISAHPNQPEAFAYAEQRAKHKPTWAVGDEAICVDLGDGKYVYAELDMARKMGLKGQRVKVVEG